MEQKLNLREKEEIAKQISTRTIGRLEEQLNTLQELQEQIDLSPTIMLVIRDLQENMEQELIEIINKIIFLLSE